MKRLSPILIAGLVSACCSMPEDHRAAAARVAAQAQCILPAVARRLGVPMRPVVVELACGELDHGRTGVAYEGRIVLARRAADRPFTDFILAHEAVHILLPEELRVLPGAVQEGLADFLAIQLEPVGGAMRLTSLDAVLASGIQGGWGIAPSKAFELSLEQVGVEPDERRHEFNYALGLALVSHLGLLRLTELCLEARAEDQNSLAIPRLCAQAGLDESTPLGWSIALRIPESEPGGKLEWPWSGHVQVRSE